MPAENPITTPIEQLYDQHDVEAHTFRRAKVAVSTLNQWALDFDGNRDRIIESIEQAKAEGARLRLGPELEVSGYSCEDHFYEQDTMLHSMEVLAQILNTDATHNILSAIGMPVMHDGVRYNCDVYVINGKIVGIRPKQIMADDGNYREPRWFTSWQKKGVVESFKLSPLLQKVTGQAKVPIGDFVIETADTVVGSEKCEEMFTPANPGIDMALDGTEILNNGSGSHWELRKLRRRLELIQGATSKAGGVYLYSNLVGGDGGRLLFDGSSVIANNGKLVAQGPQFSMKEVETTTAVVDLEAVTSQRGSVRSLGQQADGIEPYPRIKLSDLGIDFSLSGNLVSEPPSPPMEPNILSPEEEILYGPALWLWDYLRRSGASGFFLPLSGGLDSGATATIVGSMCRMVVAAVDEGNETVLADIRRIVADESYTPTDPRELAGRIFITCYEANDGISSNETEDRARALADQIGAYFAKADISKIVAAFRATAQDVLEKDIKFETEGGTPAEDVALQNLQARTRMVLSYLLAQLFRVSQDPDDKRFLLVLGSANVDEANRGYFTKYDCSSADINPIGGINKTDLRSALQFAADNFGYSALLDILGAPPTAELQPTTTDYEQNDEDDMGMTYDELRTFAKLRKQDRLGPVKMFEQLVIDWGPDSPKKLTLQVVADKVKFFFKMYAINRHKLTTLTPAVHAEGYSPDDNRFDLRPFLLNMRWTFQFSRIDQLVKKYEAVYSD